MKLDNGIPNPVNIHFGIDAGPVGPFVQNSNYRNRISVSDACSEIKLAGHGHNRLRSILQNNSPGQCPTGGHGDL